VQGRGWHYLLPGAAGFEDGTLNYLGIPAVEIGLRHLERVGMEVIHQRVTCLTGWLLEALRDLHHSSGVSLARLYGPPDLRRRGGTIAFNLQDPEGRLHHFRHVETLAAQAGISLRTGCFCNPGAGEIAHGIAAQDMARCFTGTQPVSFDEFITQMREASGKTPSTVRISVGLASNVTDAQRFIRFVAGFRDRSALEVASRLPAPESAGHGPDTA